MMKNNRRDFLKIAGVAAIGAAVKPATSAYAIGEQFVPEGQAENKSSVKKATKWGVVIDTNKLTKELMHKISKACHLEHNVPDEKNIENEDHRNPNHEIKWIWGEEFKHAFTDKTDRYLADKFEHIEIPVLCNHCVNPSCVKACPTKATFSREDGIVLMDFHRCIGCRFCMAACPFGSRSFNFKDPRPGIKKHNKKFPTRMKGVVEKCNLCAERLAVGKNPVCMEVSEGAITIGDLENETSDFRKLLKDNYTIRRKQSLGTEPSVYYIV
ncbi:MAG: 4Fe-4S dicluster domain-containing protein [Desulfobacterales bacterium]|nr:4Fe-4S dicluster domain-containing protein [Desulfobacterales bacterium]MCP4162344.1 4Fe-4S dicluster domain-containing protein [Deltaproteobacteria bacterium]